MEDIRNITGIEKQIFNFRVRWGVFSHFLPDLLKGKTSIHQYILFLKRLTFFLSKLQHNKFVRIGKNTRLGLYIPGFPSKAFYTACRKFMVFNEKLPDTTVLISVTSACRFRCEHCYQKRDLGRDIDIEKMVRAVRRLQDMGVAFFNIEGGEPFLVYERLKKICEAIDDRSEIWINSTGDGMTLERLKGLKRFNMTAVMFSLHTRFPEVLNRFMKSENAWPIMEKGVKMCHEANIPVAFNICLRKNDFYNGVFEKVMEKAKGFNASIIQLIKPKPAGGWLEIGADNFSDDDLSRIKKLVNLYNQDGFYRDYPSISAQIMEEDRDMFGCTAGGTDRFYINAKGDVQPCEFLNISFGNIGQKDFDNIYYEMRKNFKKPGDCWLCETCHKDIVNLIKEKNIKALPIDENLSREIYAHWDRGETTPLYDRIENILK